MSRKIYQIIFLFFAFNILILSQSFCIAQTDESTIHQTKSMVGFYSMIFAWDKKSLVPKIPPSGLKNIPTHSELVEVDVFTYDSNLYIDWMIDRNPGSVVGGVFPAKVNDDGSISFSFIDGWGTKGEGRFSQAENGYIITFQVLQRKIGSEDVWGYYNTRKLSKINDQPRDNRHPWSLGRNISKLKINH